MCSYDLCFVTDATGSMDKYLKGLKQVLPEIIAMSRLTCMFDEISIIAFKDYSDKDTMLWSGWTKQLSILNSFVSKLTAEGGADHPEAIKTALHTLSKSVTKETIAVILTDAPPHHRFVGSEPKNLRREQTALGDHFDWIRLCTSINANQIKCYSVLSCHDALTTSFYSMLADVSGGMCLCISVTEAEQIAHNIIGLFLSMCGQSYDFKDVKFVQTPSMDKGQLYQFEELACPYLPDRRGYVNVSENALTSTDVNQLIHDVDNYIHRFKEDRDYRENVFAIFDNIFTAEHILTLTYNTLFGKFWRAICKCRDDPRRDNLVQQMSRVMSTLHSEDQNRLKDFIEQSYDETENIESVIYSYPKCSTIVLESRQIMQRKEIMELSRSCQPTVLQKVSCLLTNVISVQSQTLPDRWLPSSMPADELFKYLPHLMCPGTLYSLRPAAILAVIAVVTESILQFQAENFLETVKGKWINFELPENSAFEFVKLVSKIPHLLTQAEVSTISFLRDIGSVGAVMNAKINVITSADCCKAVRPDHKISCNVCSNNRSFTLLNSDDICALCSEGSEVMPDPLKEDSYWCECHVCKVHYAVIRPNDLNVRPRCYFCRFKGAPAPFKRCDTCFDKFMWQGNDIINGMIGLSEYQAHDQFQCPSCRSGLKYLETHEIELKDLIAENGSDVTGLQFDHKLFERRSVFKNKDFIERSNPDKQTITIFWQGKRVHNLEEVQERLKMLMSKGETELVTCSLCFEDVLPHHLYSPCGRKGCSSKVCVSCLQAWYGQNHPGHICLISQVLCPFCKKKPTLKTIKKGNAEMLTLKNFDLDSLDPTWYHGWCEDCDHLKPVVEKRCTQEPPALMRWSCEDCRSDLQRHAHEPEVCRKNCPGCGALTERNGGCAHMTCPQIKDDGCPCATDWCWLCGYIQQNHDIYSHISREHGGGYGFDEDNDDDSQYHSDDDFDY